MEPKPCRRIQLASVYETINALRKRARDEYMKQLVRETPTEVWQLIACNLPLKDKIHLAICNNYFHDEVVFGPNSAVFAWRDGVHDVAAPPEHMIVDAAKMSASARVIGVLLKAKADPNQQIAYGEPVLVWAAMLRDVETARALLAAGADVNGRTRYGSTALMLATDDPQLMHMLLDAGADVNAVNWYGKTALMYACIHHADAVQRLLAANADVNMRTKSGWTALKYANLYSGGGTISLLVEHGAVE